MNIKQIVKRILLEEFSEEKKQRIYDKVVDRLTNSIYVTDKGNTLEFWFMSDKTNEKIFVYNKKNNTLTVLKGKVRNYLELNLPESLGKTFRTSVLTRVFKNKASSLLKINSIDFQD